ncbi:MAG TPA: aminotransferase class V-fold PLP-dependent enzyme [Ignavibacteria bacterium]|nr:phosphoserine aminotransferase [Bacteroidota bacterium]HRI85793.1 aminotransferase class V-fold PLP-dependent enzyme [Ignavibacteria bacterium]HRJ99081.1 aminotransferase class V-fold PLP-dependent enzyme [Ignavibacteria bacterium]
MKKIYFTPGPTELYPGAQKDLLEALDKKIFSFNHRSPEFMDIYKRTVNSLKNLMNIPDSFHIFFLSSATECMDRIIMNCSAKDTFHFVNGAFADRFYKTAIDLKRNAVKADAEYGSGFDFDNVKIENNPEVICITQNETSTGVAIDVENIYKLKKDNPNAVIAVDIVTSAPYVNLDFNLIDCTFFSVQKGFGLPAGLGVLMVNERCIERAAQLHGSETGIGSYHNFLTLLENAKKYQTSETPNVLGIYLLGKVCDHYLEEGIENIRKSTDEKAELVYDYFDNHNLYKPFVKIPADRSKTILVIDMGDRQSQFKKALSENGYIAGSGYGKLKDTQIRIANFPIHKLKDVKNIIEVVNKIY